MKKHTEQILKRDSKTAKHKAKKVQRAKETLELVHKHIPAVTEVDWSVKGKLTEMGLSHYFHGTRSEIEDEFNTSVSVEIMFCLPVPEGEPEDFDNHISFNYSAEQVWDAGASRVEFHLSTERPVTGLYFGEFTTLPVSKEAFRNLFHMLIDRLCDDEPTAEYVAYGFDEVFYTQTKTTGITFNS